MATTWNSTYEAQPKGRYNPGYGAAEFRTLKKALSDRLKIEHIFTYESGENVYTGGTHREGSARVEVLDPNSSDSDRTNNKIDVGSSSDFGRLRADLTERSSALTVNTDAATDHEGTLFHKFETIANISGTASVETVYDYDWFVNLKHDQLGAEGIGGIKEFTSKARVQNINSGYWSKSEEGGNFDPLSDNEDEKLAVNLKNFRDAFVEAKEHNIFEVNGYNSTYFGSDGVEYTDKDIKCRTVTAENVYGAVWG